MIHQYRNFLFLLASILPAQTYDLLLRGGHVIDPANGVTAVRDVAITGNTIARVAADIPVAEAKKVIELRGQYVVPGLIDLHMHVFGYSGALDPDEAAFPTGATTIVDAGGAGYRTFDNFKRTVIDKAATRVLALVNIAGNGMIGSASEDNVADMLPDKTAEVIRRYPDQIVGIKVAHFGHPGWDALKRAVEAGRLANVPIMVDDKIFTNAGRTSREKLLDVMRPGDMHTHMYNDRQVEIVSRFNGKVEEYAIEARRRGVLFDLGHGGGSFLWPVAVAAARQGFWPDTISTDLHTSSILGAQSDMPNCMSKMMLLGMTLDEAVRRSTEAPARAIRRFPEIGTLGQGRVADIAVLNLREGVFAFKDAWGKKMLGQKRLECVLTVRNGRVVYQRELPQATSAQPVYDLLIRASSGDLAIAGGKIARTGSGISAASARQVIDATGYQVKPGLTAPVTAKNRQYYAYTHGITTIAPSRPAADLREGAPADVTLWAGERCILTVHNGRVVWDAEGLAAMDSRLTGPYSNFK
ncbi:MAG: amidohydrolase/deacetylase family metallohydrolase [Acidobacteriia bacterium]|nr:amidohydrolase/deacetylase family metallohydrolase [Terriglobia bacterium]